MIRQILQALLVAGSLSELELAAWLSRSGPEVRAQCWALADARLITTSGLWSWKLTVQGLHLISKQRQPEDAGIHNLQPTTTAPDVLGWRAHLDGPHDLRAHLASWMVSADLDDDTRAQMWAHIEGA